MKRVDAFLNALRGGGTLLATQAHARFHAAATVGVIGLGLVARLAREEWALIALAVAIVWMAEAFNTALEFLADEVTMEHRERIRRAKDVAAFGVLVAAIGAAGIGVVVFGPRILDWVASAG